MPYKFLWKTLILYGYGLIICRLNPYRFCRFEIPYHTPWIDRRPSPPPRDIDSSVGLSPVPVVRASRTGSKCGVPSLWSVFSPTGLLFFDRAVLDRAATGSLASRAFALARSAV